MRNHAREVVIIGHKGHPEVEDMMGQSPDGMYFVETVDDASIVIDALRKHFPEVQGPKQNDIC